MRSADRTGDGGYIVVETIGVFVLFVLLVASVLSLVNIVAVQARMHYAMTQAANTLSMYSYTLEVLGVANDLTTLDNKASKAASEFGAIKNNIGSVLTTIDSISGSGNAGGGSGGDPQSAVNLLMNYGVNELRNKAFEELARPLVGRYLSNGGMTGDAYLTGAGVVNRQTGAVGLDALEFCPAGLGSLNLLQQNDTHSGNSVLIDGGGNVKLVVEYEIMYTFGGLPLPFSPTLRITQTVVTKAWLNGSGKGYW